MNLKLKTSFTTKGRRSAIPPRELRRAEETAWRIEAGLEPAIPHSVARRILIEGVAPLKAYREWRGLSVPELARQARLCEDHVRRVERRAATLSRAEAARAASILGLDPDLLRH